MSGHKTDTNYERHRCNTSLSKHIWNLKEEDKDYEIEWSLVEKSTDFNPTSKKCNICLKEKFYIMYDRGGSSLEEVFNTWRHRKQKLLSNVKT